MGFPKTKKPVMAAEHTNSKSAEIVVIIVSFWLEKELRSKNINDATKIIYAAVPKELTIALIITLPIIINIIYLY